MTSRVFVAGVALALAVALALGSGAAADVGSPCPSSNPPNEVVPAGGSGQTAQLGKPFPENFQVQLANTNGCPLTGSLAGINIDFDAPGSGPSGIFAGSGSREAVIGTDARGIAIAPTFTANDAAGNYTADAHSDYGSVEFFLSNTAAGLPAAITAAGTTGQEATIESRYPQPLTARVTDAGGSPVQGATVSFIVLPGATGAGASFLGGGQASATTDSNGLASSPPLLANGIPGRFVAAASTDGISSVATYTLDNHAAAVTIASTTGTHERATVASRFLHSLQARVLDASGQPVEGTTVTFTISAADSGAGASFLGGTTQATALTDANGRASSPPLLANTTAGTFSATAAAAAAATAAEYTLTNRAGEPSTISAGTASGESTTVGTAFPIRLAVTVTDRYGNPIAHAPVRFTAPTRGASGRFLIPQQPKKGRATQGTRKKQRAHTFSRTAPVRTDTRGVAVAPALVANAKMGGYLVIATVRGMSRRASFALVNLGR